MPLLFVADCRQSQNFAKCLQRYELNIERRDGALWLIEKIWSFILCRSWFQSAAFFFTDIPKRYCGFVVLTHHVSFLMQTLALIFIACFFQF